MDALRRKHVPLDRFDQRHQRCRTGADPVGKRRYVAIDPLTRINRALAIEWQMQAVLCEQDMSEQVGACPPACNRVRGGRRLGDALARAAGELRGMSSSVSVTSSPILCKAP